MNTKYTTGEPIPIMMNRHCVIYHPCQFPDNAMEVTLFHNEQKVSVHCVEDIHLAGVCEAWQLRGKKPAAYTVYGTTEKITKQLISAAPDLLEACKVAMVVISQHHPEDSDCCRERIATIKAAISKATT